MLPIDGWPRAGNGSCSGEIGIVRHGLPETPTHPGPLEREDEASVPRGGFPVEATCDLPRALTGDTPVTSAMLKGILATEEEHVDELADLLE